MQPERYLPSTLDCFAKEESERYGELLSRLLLKKYPQIKHESLHLGELLNWKFWPVFIKVYCECISIG